MKKFLTMSECAEVFNAPISTIVRWCEKGKIPTETHQGKNSTFVPILELINWLHETDKLPRKGEKEIKSNTQPQNMV